MGNENIDINQPSSIIKNDEAKYIGFRLDHINLKIAKNSLTFVLGKVGSGKTSL